MAILDGIRHKVGRGLYELSQHAADQAIKRQITIDEVEQAIAAGEIIENYPDDKYGPSCLVLGFTRSERPLHVQCSYPSRALVKLITMYQPDPELWIDLRVRRR